MNSGILMDEDYTRASDATNMLFRERDFAAFYDTLPVEAAPGEKWVYSSGKFSCLDTLNSRQNKKTHFSECIVLYCLV
jgi:hypothetical protein